MAITFHPYTAELEPGVGAFNARLEAGGCPFRFFTASRSNWLPREDPAESLYEEFFVGTEGDDVRGGYALKHQLFQLQGETTSIGCIYLPLSEGAVDKRWSGVAPKLLAHALKRQPLIYCLGMGSMDAPYARLLRAAGWTLHAVGFRFRVVRARPFLRELTLLRRRPAARLALDLAAASRLGDLGLGAARGLLALRGRGRNLGRVRVEPVESFGPWADELWEAARATFSLAAVRDARVLNRLYPAATPRQHRLRIERDGACVGWAVVIDTQMKTHKQFGAMRLGSVIDCLARPGGEADVISGATRFLEARGVDLVVTNQSHEEWGAACATAGFLPGPSNYIFAASPRLASRLAPLETAIRRIHMLRGDGEGPSHL